MWGGWSPLTAEEFLQRWNGMSCRERDVWVAEAVLGYRVTYVRTLEGYRVQGDSARGEFEPVVAEVPCLEEHGVVACLACLPDAEYVLNVVPCYTAEVGAAWEVVEHLRRRFGAVAVEAGGAAEEAFLPGVRGGLCGRRKGGARGGCPGGAPCGLRWGPAGRLAVPVLCPGFPGCLGRAGHGPVAFAGVWSAAWVRPGASCCVEDVRGGS